MWFSNSFIRLTFFRIYLSRTYALIKKYFMNLLKYIYMSFPCKRESRNIWLDSHFRENDI